MRKTNTLSLCRPSKLNYFENISSLSHCVVLPNEFLHEQVCGDS